MCWCLGGLREKAEEVLSSMVICLVISKETNQWNFEDKAIYFHLEIQALILKMLYSWCVVLNGESNLKILDCVGCIMDESLRRDVFYLPCL